MASAGEQLLQRLGYGPNIITPDWIKQVAEQMGQYVNAGGLSMDDALVELRTQIEGRRAGTGGYVDPSAAPATNNSAPAAGPEQTYSLIAKLVELGIPPQTAAMLVATDPLGALKFLANPIGGSGGGRTQFASEQALDEAQTRLASANAAQQEWQNSVLSGGSRLTVGPNGLLVDQITGQTVDPASIGLSRDQFNFQSGPQFQENIRQFNQSNATDLRGQDINLALGNLNAQNTANRNAADAAIGFGNLGVAQTDQIRGILSRPSDTLARLYMQRGGQSPTAFISQADLLNAFNSQIKGINDLYQSQLNNFKPASVGGALPLQPAKPAITPMPTPTANPYPDFNSTDPEEPGGFTNPASDTYQNDGWYSPGAEQQALFTQDEVPGGSYGIQEALEQLQAEANANRHATGGYTQDKVFLGNEKGSELFINPTGAPITIVPHNKTTRLMGKNIKGYDEGTPSAGANTRLKAAPTGGFWNSLREVLGGVEGAVNAGAREAQDRFSQDLAADPSRFAMGPGTAIGSIDDVLKSARAVNPAQASRFAEMAAARAKANPALAAGKAIESSRSRLLEIYDELDKLPVGSAARKALEQEQSQVISRLGRERTNAQKLRSMEKKDFTDVRKTLMNEISDLEDAMKQFKDFPEMAKIYQAKLEAKMDDLVRLNPNATKDVDMIDPGIPSYANGTIDTGYYSYGYNGGAPVTQGELSNLATQAAGPGVQSVVSGSRLAPFNIPGMQSPTLRSVNQLSGAEKEAFNTYLATNFNSTIDDLMHQLNQRYRTGNSRMARFRG